MDPDAISDVKAFLAEVGEPKPAVIVSDVAGEWAVLLVRTKDVTQGKTFRVTKEDGDDLEADLRRDGFEVIREKGR